MPTNLHPHEPIHRHIYICHWPIQWQNSTTQEDIHNDRFLFYFQNICVPWNLSAFCFFYHWVFLISTMVIMLFLECVSTNLSVQCNVYWWMKYLIAMKQEIRSWALIGMWSSGQNSGNLDVIWRKSEIKENNMFW